MKKRSAPCASIASLQHLSAIWDQIWYLSAAIELSAEVADTVHKASAAFCIISAAAACCWKVSGRDNEPMVEINSNGRCKSFKREISNKHQMRRNGLICSSTTITAPQLACARDALNGPSLGFPPTSSAALCWFRANKQIQNTKHCGCSVIFASAHKARALTVLLKSWPQ